MTTSTKWRKVALSAVACLFVTGVLLVGIQSAAAGDGSVTCTDAFAGTAINVIVPHDNACDLSGATVTNDVIVEHDAGLFGEGVTVGHDIRLDHDSYLELGGASVGNDVRGTITEFHLERTTIGGSLVALKPLTVQTGHNGPDSPGGPVRIGRDLVVTGSPDEDFVFDGMCSLNIGHDARIVDRTVNFGIGFGDHCAGREPNTVGHDLVFTNDSAEIGFFGPSVIEVGNNTVGHDLVFTHNTAAPGGYLEVSDNQVGGNAICEANSPAVGSPEPQDGPNIVAGKNTCG
jgi:hypothetical protein